jgi:uncharacterized membrane protein YgaE (UPF0421/DUF939 family)
MVNNSGASGQLREWFIAKANPPSVAHVALTAVATVASYLIARLFRLQEAYWAPMSTIIVIQLTLGAALPVSMQYIGGTAVGAAVGAATDTYFHGSVWACGAAIVVIGLMCVLLGVESSAFRNASSTLVIVMLVPRSTSARLVALHRFFEVSIGIAVGLALFTMWQKMDLGTSARVTQTSAR